MNWLKVYTIADMKARTRREAVFSFMERFSVSLPPDVKGVCAWDGRDKVVLKGIRLGCRVDICVSVAKIEASLSPKMFAESVAKGLFG